LIDDPAQHPSSRKNCGPHSTSLGGSIEDASYLRAGYDPGRLQQPTINTAIMRWYEPVRLPDRGSSADRT
jgi:hypothetical protein